jgi:hypothetical protein
MSAKFLVDIKLSGILRWHRFLFPVTQEAYMTNSACFSYPGDVPPGPRQMGVTTSCFRYPADVPLGPRQMTVSSSCFKYPTVSSAGMGNTGGCFGYAAPPALRSPRAMGYLHCFRY